jgi:hypothetical protein
LKEAKVHNQGVALNKWKNIADQFVQEVSCSSEEEISFEVQKEHAIPSGKFSEKTEFMAVKKSEEVKPQS